MSFKPVDVAPAGDAATVDETPVSCMVCCQEVSSAAILSCALCKCGSYCSVVCLAQHENHAQYCPSICSLERLETEKLEQIKALIQAKCACATGGTHMMVGH